MPTSFYTYTGGYQYFTVPAGVTSVSIVCTGGGSSGHGAGYVSGKRAVTPGQVLVVICGSGAHNASGSNGGGTAWGGGGAGGDGNGSNGGNGGGGYSAVRVGTTTGTVICVAGGAGGDSGDNGAGGEGGASTGGSGGRGTSGSNSTGNATGGTQSQGGNGGTSSSGSQFNGHNASDTVIAANGGAGGGTNANYCVGGGGGGGGYHQGGGGQAASTGYAPGGGGGGGSNYTGGLTSAVSQRGTGGVGGGNVNITWTASAPANLPPNVPTSATVNGVAETPDQQTKSTGSVVIGAQISDPDGDDLSLMVRYSTHADFSSYTDKHGTLHTNPGNVAVTLTGLVQNTHYYVRLYAQDAHLLYSTGYNSLDFWTNRKPVAVPLTPAENATVPALSSPVFTWTVTDPDSGDVQKGFEIQYRTAATLTDAAGPWVLLSQPNTPAPSTWTFNPGTFKGSTFYEWQVRAKDNQGLWGDWSDTFSFFVSSASAPPVLLDPIKDSAFDATKAKTFTWRFVDPDPGDAQTKADIRYRLVGQGDAAWVTLLGSGTSPGATQAWAFGPDVFVTGYHYEWQARTYDTIGATTSDWTTSGTFWTTGRPGSLAVGAPVALSPLVKGTLGCGEYRAFLYFQGGEQMYGEIDKISTLQFGRLRDDISRATLTVNGVGADCGAMLGKTFCWIHELVLFRDGERVWEGPVTLLTFQGDNVIIEAQDVMVYAFRRIMRQGYNDSYQLLNGQQIGLPSVVDRATQILLNALAPYDPNILPYLTSLEFADDAKESRVVPDYSRTAWEEVDDLASTAGLDYTTVGRRIILWDTHRPIGRLPEMRDGDFSDDPIITEYGMNLCNYEAVTNGSGVWGAATPANLMPPSVPAIRGGFNHILNPGGDPIPTGPAVPVVPDPRWWKIYGPIEMLASAYGETAAGTEEVLTPAAKASLVSALEDQARRNIGARWPTPVVVRVPDNSALSPECNITFDQLIPGTWIPLRSSQYNRTVEQWQKLDSVTVNVDASGGEKVTVVMSPAPNGGEDPDLGTTAAAG